MPVRLADQPCMELQPAIQMKITHKHNARAADIEQDRRMEDLRGEKSLGRGSGEAGSGRTAGIRRKGAGT
ncbi:hypothetical protein LBMAG52_14360 [Planctomycetia bacterium]|nr:hypothetical protein LBMAG52_14360 [Planctomycetia bacterium]